jgi:hypothetical protein
MIAKIISDKDEAGIYAILEWRGVGAARDAYQKAFGVPVDSKGIDKEIEGHFLDLFDGQRRYVPARILLALVLREGGSGRSKGPAKSVARQISDEWAIRYYKRLVKNGMRAEDAAEEAAKLSMLTAGQIKDGRPNRPPRKPRRRR